MDRTKFACQAILWEPMRSREAYLAMLSEVRNCGYEGVEAGTRFLEPGDRVRFDDMGLKFVASHLGGDFRGADMNVETDKVRAEAAKVRELGGEFVFISGFFFPGKSEEDWKRDAENLNRFGDATAREGLPLCYHNHHFEFKYQQVGFRALMRYTDPSSVFLVPDVGWLTRGDIEPVEFLKQYGERVRALHFKDFTFDDHFTELGKGIVAFEPIYNFVKTQPIWIVAEQDKTDATPAESARQNAEYLAWLKNNAK